MSSRKLRSNVSFRAHVVWACSCLFYERKFALFVFRSYPYQVTCIRKNCLWIYGNSRLLEFLRRYSHFHLNTNIKFISFSYSSPTHHRHRQTVRPRHALPLCTFVCTRNMNWFDRNLQEFLKPFTVAIHSNHTQIWFFHIIFGIMDGYFDIDLCMRCFGTNDEYLFGRNDRWHGPHLHTWSECTDQRALARCNRIFNNLLG